MKKIIFFLSFVCLFSCKDSEEKKYFMQSTGKINSVAIIIDNSLWKSKVGDSIRAYLASPIQEIPGEPEPLFSIHQLPPSIFEGTTQSSRNILYVSTDKKENFKIEDNLYAKPQKVISISGKTTDDIIKSIQKNASKIISTFKENDLLESQKRFQEILIQTPQIQEKLKINLDLPNSYEFVKHENNFFWYEKRIKGGTTNLIMYEVDEIFFQKGNITENITKMRDSIGQKYIPGREEGMYMITEKAFAPSVDSLEFKSKKMYESRGTWEVKNFILAGPFVNFAFEDKKNNRFLVLEGFVMAPGFAKRDQLFELEAIIKSVKFIE